MHVTINAQRIEIFKVGKIVPQFDIDLSRNIKPKLSRDINFSRDLKIEWTNRLS